MPPEASAAEMKDADALLKAQLCHSGAACSHDVPPCTGMCMLAHGHVSSFFESPVVFRTSA